MEEESYYEGKLIDRCYDLLEIINELESIAQEIKDGFIITGNPDWIIEECPRMRKKVSSIRDKLLLSESKMDSDDSI